MIPTTLRPKSKNISPQQQIQPENEIKQNLSSSIPSTLKPKKKEEFPEEGENDLEREIERNIAQGTSRIGETVLGMPGDLYSFAKSIFGYNPETVLPTSEKLRKFSEEASLGYTKPKNEFEEKSGEALQDIASFMIPGSNKYNLVRNIGIPIVANLAKEGIKYSGSEKLGNAAKIGTMITLDLMNHRAGGAKKYASGLFNESEKMIPKGEILKSSTLEKSLLNLEKSLESGGSAPSKEKALKKISEIQSKMKNGEIEVQELVDFRKAINEIKYELGGYEVQLPKAIKKKAIANLDHVKSKVISALDEYGTKQNPEFGKLNKSANEAYAAYESSDKMASFLKKHISTKNPAIKTLLGLGGVYAFPGIATKTAIAAPFAFGAYEGYKILHQVIQSPTLRKFYGNILKGASSGNASQVSKNVKSLEKELKKESM